MNHPTMETDELLLLAHEALEDGDTEQAIQALRSASRLAPLRKDIKNELARILEGNIEPVRKPTLRSRNSPSSYDEQPESYDDGPGFKDTLEEVAQKAFRFATGTTGATTSKLTNLVSEGLKSLKFSSKPALNAPAERFEKAPIELANQSLLDSHNELEEYLEREEAYEEEVESAAVQQLESARSAEIKSPRAARKKKQKAAVEDVITEKMAHTFQQLARADRHKMALTASYITLMIFTGVACYKVGQKFPAIRGVAATAAAVSQPAQNQSGNESNALALDAVADPLEESGKLIAQGNQDKAITVLMGSLSTSLSASTKSKVNSELSSLLTKRGTENLSTSKFKESVADYKKALEYDPSNHRTMLLLGNALYHSAIPSAANAIKNVDKLKLQEAAKALENALIYDQSNQEGYAVLARTYSKLGDSGKAKNAWQKVYNNEKSSSDLKKEAKQFLSK